MPTIAELRERLEAIDGIEARSRLYDAAKVFVDLQYSRGAVESFIPTREMDAALDVGGRNPGRFQKYVASAAEDRFKDSPKLATRFARALSSMGQFAGDLPMLIPGMERLDPVNVKRRETLAAGLAAIRQGVPAESENVVYDTVLKAAEMAPPLIVSAVTGGAAAGAGGGAMLSAAAPPLMSNPALAATMFWTTQIAPGTYHEHRAAGKTHAEARNRALLTSVPEAIIETALGVMGGGEASKALLRGTGPALKNFLWNILKEYPKEIGEEGAQRVTKDLGNEFFNLLEGKGADKSVMEILHGGLTEMWEAAGPLAVLMGGQAAYTGATAAPGHFKAQREINERVRWMEAAEATARRGEKGLLPAPEMTPQERRLRELVGAAGPTKEAAAARAAQPAPEATQPPPAAQEPTQAAPVVPEAAPTRAEAAAAARQARAQARAKAKAGKGKKGKKAATAAKPTEREAHIRQQVDKFLKGDEEGAAKAEAPTGRTMTIEIAGKKTEVPILPEHEAPLHNIWIGVHNTGNRTTVAQLQKADAVEKGQVTLPQVVAYLRERGASVEGDIPAKAEAPGAATVPSSEAKPGAEAATERVRKAVEKDKLAEGLQKAPQEGTPAGPADPYTRYRVRLDIMVLDPKTFQFKLEVDKKTGVTRKLAGVSRWDRRKAKTLVLWRAKDGTIYVVDGHHRVHLASRLKAEGVEGVPDELDAWIFDEAAGYSKEVARGEAALINIAEGNATPVSAAKVIRDLGLTAKQMTDAGLDLKDSLVEQAEGLAKLTDEAFEWFSQSDLDPAFAHYVGRHTKPERQIRAMITMLKGVESRQLKTQAEAKETALRANTAKVKGRGLFGEADEAQMLAESRVAAAVEARIASSRNLAGKLLRNKSAIEAIGASQVDVKAAAGRKEAAARVLEAVKVLSRRAGPIGELVVRGAERYVATEGRKEAARKQALGEIVDDIIDQIGGIDFRAAYPDFGRESLSADVEELERGETIAEQEAEGLFAGPGARGEGRGEEEAPPEEAPPKPPTTKLEARKRRLKAKVQAVKEPGRGELFPAAETAAVAAGRLKARVEAVERRSKGMAPRIALAASEVGGRAGKLGVSRATPMGERPTRSARQGPLRRMMTAHQLSHQTQVSALAGPTSEAYRILHAEPRAGDAEFFRIKGRAFEQWQQRMTKAGITTEQLQKWSQAMGRKPEAYTLSLPSGKKLQLTGGEHLEIALHIMDPSTRGWLDGSRADGKRAPIHSIRGGWDMELSDADMAHLVGELDEKLRQAGIIMRSLGDETYTRDFMPVWLAEEGEELPVRAGHWPRRRWGGRTIAEEPFWTENRPLWLQQMGIFQERTGGVKPIIFGDAFNTFVAHITKLSAYAAKAPSVYRARLLLDDAVFQRAVSERAKFPLDRLEDWRRAIEDFQGMQLRQSSPVEEATRRFVRKFHTAALGLKPQIVLYQPVTYLNAWAAGVPFKHLAGAVVSPLKTADTRAEIKQWSPILRARLEGTGHGIITPWASANLVREAAGLPESLPGRVAMWGIHEADTQTIIRIWRAIKAEGQAKGLTGEALMDRTAERALDIVDRSQPTWDPLTSSQIAREAREGAVAQRFISLFSSVPNKNLNMAVRAIAEFKAGEISGAEMVKRAGVPMVLNAILVYGIAEGTRALWRALGGAKSKDEWDEHFWRLAGRILGHWIFFGPGLQFAFERVYRTATGKPTIFHEMRQGPVGALFTQAGRFTESFIRALQAMARGDEDAGKRVVAFLMSAAEVGGTITGLPTHGPIQALRPQMERFAKPRGGKPPKPTKKPKRPKRPR